MKYSFDVKDVVAVDLLGNNYIQLLEENQNKGMPCMCAQTQLKCMKLPKRYSTGKRWI